MGMDRRVKIPLKVAHKTAQSGVFAPKTPQIPIGNRHLQSQRWPHNDHDSLTVTTHCDYSSCSLITTLDAIHHRLSREGKASLAQRRSMGNSSAKLNITLDYENEDDSTSSTWISLYLSSCPRLVAHLHFSLSPRSSELGCKSWRARSWKSLGRGDECSQKCCRYSSLRHWKGEGPHFRRRFRVSANETCRKVTTMATNSHHCLENSYSYTAERPIVRSHVVVDSLVRRTIQPGLYHFPFTFDLPAVLPTSMSWSAGSSWCRIKVRFMCY